MITITFDDALINNQMQRLTAVPYAVQRALSPAVNEVLRLARTDLAAHLQGEIPLPPRLVAQSIRLSQAVSRDQGAEGSLTVASKPIPLIQYDVDPQEVTARKGLRSKNWPGFAYTMEDRKRRQREELPGEGWTSLPFIAQMRSRKNSLEEGGPLGVYRPTVDGKIKEVYGPRVQYHAAAPEVEHLIFSRAEANFARILPRIVDTVLADHGGQS